MLPSQCPRITQVIQAGRHREVTFEVEGRAWCRAYLSGGNVPLVQPLADGSGLTPDQAVILSVALQMARDWVVAEMARVEAKNANREAAKG